MAFKKCPYYSIHQEDIMIIYICAPNNTAQKYVYEAKWQNGKEKSTVLQKLKTSIPHLIRNRTQRSIIGRWCEEHYKPIIPNIHITEFSTAEYTFFTSAHIRPQNMF